MKLIVSTRKSDNAIVLQFCESFQGKSKFYDFYILNRSKKPIYVHPPKN